MSPANDNGRAAEHIELAYGVQLQGTLERDPKGEPRTFASLGAAWTWAREKATGHQAWQLPYLKAVRVRVRTAADGSRSVSVAR